MTRGSTLSTIGRFDGKLSAVHKDGRWFVYARANLQFHGGRFVVVAISRTDMPWGHDAYEDFRLLEIDGYDQEGPGNVYFAGIDRHPFDNDMLVGLFPINMGVPGRHDGDGESFIGMAMSCDGVRFSRFTRLVWSVGREGRTWDHPVDGLLLEADGSVAFMVHRNVQGISPHAPDESRMLKYRFNLEAFNALTRESKRELGCASEPSSPRAASRPPPPAPNQPCCGPSGACCRRASYADAPPECASAAIGCDAWHCCVVAAPPPSLPPMPPPPAPPTPPRTTPSPIPTASSRSLPPAPWAPPQALPTAPAHSPPIAPTPSTAPTPLQTLPAASTTGVSGFQVRVIEMVSALAALACLLHLSCGCGAICRTLWCAPSSASVQPSRRAESTKSHNSEKVNGRPARIGQSELAVEELLTEEEQKSPTKKKISKKVRKGRGNATVEMSELIDVEIRDGELDRSSPAQSMLHEQAMGELDDAALQAAAAEAASQQMPEDWPEESGNNRLYVD